MRTAYLIFFSLLFISSPLIAQEEDSSGAFVSGAYLLKLCETDEEGNELVTRGRASCQSYIAGIIDYHKFLRSLDTAPSIDFCVPNTEKLNDVQDKVWTYLQINAQHDDFNAAPAVTLALFEHYPCSE